MKRVSSILLAVVIAVSSVLVGGTGRTNTLDEVCASSSSYKVGNERINCANCTVNKVTYYFEQSSNKVKKKFSYAPDGCYTYNICSKKGNTRTVLVKNAEQTFATNGKYLYYIKYHNYCAYVYRMSLKTKKVKKIFKAPKKTSYYSCILDGVKGKYIYYTSRLDDGDLGYRTYVYNTKTKKNKLIAKDVNLNIWGSRLVLQQISTDWGNNNIYFAKLDGTKKKKVTSGRGCFVYNKKLYWWEENSRNEYERRLGCFDKNGKSKKYLSPWMDGVNYGNYGENMPYFSSTTKVKKNFIKQFDVKAGCSYKQSQKLYKDSIKAVRGIISYEYPYFSGKSKAIKKINADIKKQCKKFMNSSDAKLIKKEVKAAIKKNQFTSYDEYYYYEASCNITYKKKNIVSICIIYNWNDGGTYPSYGYKNLTYNTKTGKKLSYKDVISGNAKQKVVKACKKYFKGAWNYDEIIKYIKKKKSYQFYLKDGKAYICFNRGELFITGAPVVLVTAKYK